VAEKLTPKQECFCLEYVKSGNATKAYRLAYNAQHMKPAVIAVKACELLKNGKVTVRVDELAARVKAVLEHKFDITVERIAEELARLAFFNPADLYDENDKLIPPNKLPKHVAAALQQVEEYEEFEGRGKDRELVGFTKKVKWHDKKASLEVLAKYRGMLIERKEVRKPSQFSDLSDAELDAEIKSHEAFLKAAKVAGKQPASKKNWRE
jgi:phage terminase small subunit